MNKPVVIAQDSALLVLNKPAGLVVNRARTVKTDTLQDQIESQYRFELAGNQGWRNGIVHRLDKDTSGILLVAKTKESFEKLKQQFMERSVAKTYLCLVHGLVEPKKGSIKLPVARSLKNRERFAVSVSGKKALTSWEVEKYYQKLKIPDLKIEYQGFSLLKLMPETGRTHQLRVHLSHLKHPVVGDSRYLGKKRSREDRKWCPRQFLHAHKISFKHPESGKRVEYAADLPQDLKKALSFLE